MRPWERISIDFKGPRQSKRPYVLFVVDEFSRFSFAFPCNMKTETVINPYPPESKFFVHFSIVALE